MKVYIGIDAHTTNYTLAFMTNDMDKPGKVGTYSPDCKNILYYVKDLKKQYGNDIEVIAGYEAGCLGFTLKRQLEKKDVKCVVIAPTSMPDRSRKGTKKTDKRDAVGIARDLCHNDYSEVYMPDEEDEAVRDYIRMRQDHKEELKHIKQRVIAFCTRHGFTYYDGHYWTQKHLNWLRSLEMSDELRIILDEYMRSYDDLTDRIADMDKHIEELSEKEKYKESVHKLICIKGISVLTALALCVEIGDFRRFAKAKNFAAFLGLVPGEHSSSTDVNRLGITKQGNRFLRKLLTEAVQCYSRAVSKKSKLLKQRQEGNPTDVIAYADKANERMRKRYYHLVMHNKLAANKACTAIAREMAGFIWGMMTDHIQPTAA